MWCSTQEQIQANQTFLLMMLLRAVFRPVCRWQSAKQGSSHGLLEQEAAQLLAHHLNIKELENLLSPKPTTFLQHYRTICVCVPSVHQILQSMNRYAESVWCACLELLHTPGTAVLQLRRAKKKLTIQCFNTNSLIFTFGWKATAICLYSCTTSPPACSNADRCINAVTRSAQLPDGAQDKQGKKFQSS